MTASWSRSVVAGILIICQSERVWTLESRARLKFAPVSRRTADVAPQRGLAFPAQTLEPRSDYQSMHCTVAGYMSND